MDYKIICHWNWADFEHLVNYNLHIGWELQGGASVTGNSPENRWYVQAMVKKEDLTRGETSDIMKK